MISEILNTPQQYSNYKGFVLQDEKKQTQKVQFFPVNQGDEYLNLQNLFENKIQGHQFYSFRIYDFRIDQYIDLKYTNSMEYKIPMEFVKSCPHLILIKYKETEFEERAGQMEKSSHSEDKSLRQEVFSIKKQRSQQRIISEVIQIIKRWRDLHRRRVSEKRISLQQAAKRVGLPKKSLDDYYYQLKLGEKYDFDFKINFYEKIGCLRNFNKQKLKKCKQQILDKDDRQLKIIDLYDEIKTSEQGRMRDNQQQYYEQSQNYYLKEDDKMVAEGGVLQGQIKVQTQFYQDFGFMQSHPDSFVGMETNFKKKKHDNNFDQQLFF